MKQVVSKAVRAMEEAEDWMRQLGLGRLQNTPADVSFTCGLKVGRVEAARLALAEHEERSERARSRSRKARGA